jgi:hypothetical protein
MRDRRRLQDRRWGCQDCPNPRIVSRRKPRIGYHPQGFRGPRLGTIILPLLYSGCTACCHSKLKWALAEVIYLRCQLPMVVLSGTNGPAWSRSCSGASDIFQDALGLFETIVAATLSWAINRYVKVGLDAVLEQMSKKKGFSRTYGLDGKREQLVFLLIILLIYCDCDTMVRNCDGQRLKLSTWSY